MKNDLEITGLYVSDKCMSGNICTYELSVYNNVGSHI